MPELPGMGLESVELVIAWEQEFRIRISNTDAASLVTPAHAEDFIARVLGDEGRPVDRASIAEAIRRTTLDVSGMKAVDYRTDGRFVQDFGLD